MYDCRFLKDYFQVDKPLLEKQQDVQLIEIGSNQAIIEYLETPWNALKHNIPNNVVCFILEHNGNYVYWFSLMMPLKN
ncbi:hypothetical protein [Photobacterium kishitanii]|uniref:hypothetical protein n=1 Tax=Photobacterium kishitanii TaxID=318456 RepID=UPI0011B20E6A|nr:hypothetical protein [Photobacterium kishitanii]